LLQDVDPEKEIVRHSYEKECKEHEMEAKLNLCKWNARATTIVIQFSRTH